MLSVRFVVHGEVIVDRVLAGIEDRAKNLGPAWPAVVEAFREIEARVFATEGGSTGAKWRELAPSTQADRVREGYLGTYPILERTGNLKRALTTGEGAFVATTPTTLRYVLGEAVDYFKYHQSPRPRRHLPRRAIVQLTADDRTALVDPIRRYVTGHDPRGGRRSRVV